MNKSEKTLVILTPGFAKDEQDSTCLPMQQQLIRTLKELHPELNIIILSFQYPYHTKNYEWFNTPVIPFNGRNKGGLPRLLLRKKIIRALKKIHTNTPITGLLSFWYGECAATGKLFADKYNLKHFCWILGQDAKKDNKYPKRVGLGAGELIALSDFVQKEFEKNHGIKPDQVIPVGIDIKQFDKESKEKDIDILGAGSLIPLKRYDLFLETVAEIKKKVPDLKALLIGKGPEKDRLQDLIRQYGLQSTVTLTGELPYHEVLRHMQRAKVFLHPSSYEGFSAVCAEAIYAGCQVISFCKTMNAVIPQWSNVSSQEEIVLKATNFLSGPVTYNTVLFCSIEDVAKKMWKLFF